jgi:hypothetical protein
MHSTGEGFLKHWDRVSGQWDLQCTGAEGFWARRARTSIDVLGPGVLVGRVAGFGVS